MSDSTPSPDLPAALHILAVHILAAHISEHPIPRPYGIFPLHRGGVRITFYDRNARAALAFAASLAGHAAGVRYWRATSPGDGAYYSITITGAALGLTVEVVVHPSAAEGDTVESVTAMVESALAAATEALAGTAVSS